MRRLTTPLILVAVLAGLLGYIYFVDANRPAGGTETLPKAFEVSPENIVEVRLTNADGDTSRVERIDATWQLLEPEKADADATAVASVTSSLASLEVQRVVDDNPADLAQYGLNPPRIDLSFRVRGEEVLQRLLVGEQTPTGGDLYAKKPDETRVFLISSFLDTTFNKTAFDFRDKAILKFVRDSANGLEIVRGVTTVELARDGINWRIVRPMAVRADYATAEGIMTRLSAGRLLRIVAEEADDLRPYGLDRPALTASVLSDSSRATLLLGASADNGLYAKDASRPAVFAVEESLATELERDLFEFRRKDMFDARSYTANRIELHQDDETLTFEKTIDEGEDVWRNAWGEDVDTMMVEELLTKLSNLLAQSFESTPHISLETPVLTAIVRFDEDKTESVTLGRSGSDVFGGRSDEPGSARLEATVFDEAIAAVDALK